MSRGPGRRRARRRIGQQDTAPCVACGIDMTLTDVKVAHHLNGDVDHDLDADHVAIATSISYAVPTETGDFGGISA